MMELNESFPLSRTCVPALKCDSPRSYGEEIEASQIGRFRKPDARRVKKRGARGRLQVNAVF